MGTGTVTAIEPAPIDGRVATPPTGPGLGVEPGPEVIARFA